MKPPWPIRSPKPSLAEGRHLLRVAAVLGWITRTAPNRRPEGEILTLMRHSDESHQTRLLLARSQNMVAIIELPDAGWYCGP